MLLQNCGDVPLGGAYGRGYPAHAGCDACIFWETLIKAFPLKNYVDKVKKDIDKRCHTAYNRCSAIKYPDSCIWHNTQLEGG